MTTQLLVIGDVGDPTFHVGDEAMFETALGELTRRGDVSVTAIASGPELVARRYGVAAVGQLGFDPRRGAGFDDGRDQRLRRVLERSVDEPTVEAWWSAVDRADAVLVAGGGNLCSSWPHLVYERIALLRAGIERGLPVVLVGQSVGPHLTPRQSEWLAPLLRAAHLVGVRDLASEAFVRTLSPAAPVLLHVDDAIALPDGPRWPGTPERYVAMSFHPLDQPATDALRDTVAGVIRTANEATGADVVLLPNTGSFDGPHAHGTDAHLLEGWATAFPTDLGVRVAPVLSSREFAATVRGSLGVVSSRFHPVVFALGASVPAIALTTDRYTTAKLSGVLTHAGLDGWRLPFASLGTATPDLLVAELSQRRDELTAHLAATTASWTERHAARWDLVWSCLTGRRPDVAVLRTPPSSPPLEPTTPTRLVQQLADGWYDREDRLVRAAEAAEAHTLWLEGPTEWLPHELADLTLDEAMRHDRLAAALAALERERLAADAAREVAGRAYHELATFEPPTDEVDRQYVVSLERELAAMQATRLFRWTSPLRSAYGRVRRVFRTSGSRHRS